MKSKVTDLLELSNIKDMDISKIQGILESNKNKNFVQRILTPNDYPTLDLGGGNYATHKMSYSSIDTKEGKKFIVYPNIIHYPQAKNLISLNPDIAMKYAISSGEYIPFDNEKEAEWFSKNYKKVWDNPLGEIPLINMPAGENIELMKQESIPKTPKERFDELYVR